MRAESGRSIIEMIGVMAIAALMIAAATSLYTRIRSNMRQTQAMVTLQGVARDTKLLMGHRGTYDGISVQYLINNGVIKSTNAPMGNEWAIEPIVNENAFKIILRDVSMTDCEYVTTAIPYWAARVDVNGYETDNTDHCFSSDTNQIVFTVQ